MKRLIVPLVVGLLLSSSALAKEALVCSVKPSTETSIQTPFLERSAEPVAKTYICEHPAEAHDRFDYVNLVLTLVFTGTVALFTARLFYVTRNAFHATHRPRIRVRRIVLDDPETLTKGVGTVTTKGVIHIANIGATAADIIEGQYQIIISDGGVLPRLAFKDFPSRSLEPRRLNAGEYIDAAFGSEVFIAKGMSGVFQAIAEDGQPSGVVIQSVSLGGGRNDSFALGRIRYKDNLGVTRETGFFRRYDRSTNCFVPLSENPDYEYED